MDNWYNIDTKNYVFSWMIASFDSFLIAKTQKTHKIRIMQIKQCQMKSNRPNKNV